MTLILKDNNITINHRLKQNYYELSINYKSFEFRMEELYKTNIFYSTYWQSGTIDGFIPLSDNLFVRILVIHRLGAIGKINNGPRYKEFYKMKINPVKEKIVISIFPDDFRISGMPRYFESKFSITYPELSDFYIYISLASSRKLIINRMNEKSLHQKESLQKDFLESEKNRIYWSQNSDGERTHLEYFSGTGSNIGHRKPT